jgi:ribosomal protein L7/L12
MALMTPEIADNFDWMSFCFGFAGAAVLMVYLGWRKRRRAASDLTVPPKFPAQPAALPSDLRPMIVQMTAEGRKIEAIKLVRERMGIGLAEAKDLVDKIG